MSDSRRAVLVLVLGATCISFAPVFVKVLGRTGLGPSAIGFWRCAIGAAVLVALAAATRVRLRLTRPALRLATIAGVVFFLDLFCWHRAILDAGAGMATILGNTQVFGTALLSAWLFREPVRPRFLAAAVLAVAGVALLAGVGSDVALTATYVRGVVLGLLTGLCYAVYLVTLRGARRLDPAPPPLALMAWTSLFSAPWLGGAALASGEAGIPAGVTAWALAIGLAVVAQSLGWWAISGSLPRVSGATGSLLLLLQPVLATVWGRFLFGERLAPLQVAGAAATLVAIWVGSTGTVRVSTPRPRRSPGSGGLG